MISLSQIANFIGGFGLLLFGLHIFEESIKNLTNKTFKSLLRKFTNTKFKAILTGIFATSILQSSTLVSFITIAFVGAGVLNFSNAVGIVIGTNIGGVLPDVILGNIGLKFNITTLSFFIIGGAGFLSLIIKRGTIHTIANAFFGLGILFLGLGFIKDTMIIFAHSFNFLAYQNFPIWFFFIIGIILTMMIYSSSAMIIIILTAANSGLIKLESGMGLIMGAFLGTSLTVLLLSLGSNQYKKQTAMSHVAFNVFSILLGFLTFPFMVKGLSLLGFEKNIVNGLSFFTIGFKIIGAIIFFPFINIFVRGIQYLIPERKNEYDLFIEKTSPAVFELAIMALRQDIIKLLKKIFAYNMHIFSLNEKILLHEKEPFKKILSLKENYSEEILIEEYQTIKSIEEKLITFGLDMKKNSLDRAEIQQIRDLYKVISTAVYSAKYFKDIRLNIKNLEESESTTMQKKLFHFRKTLIYLYKNISHIINGNLSPEIFNNIINILKDIKNDDQKFLSELSKDLIQEKLDAFELSGLINIYRYFYLSCFSIISAIKDLYLDKETQKIFEEI